MSKEMGGQTDSKEVEFIITHQIGEVPSSIADGSPVEIEDPFSFYVKRLAKNHVDVPDHEIPRTPDALLATASRAELVNTNIKPDTLQNICTIADAKIEAVEQNFTLSNETKSFAKGLKENLRALPVFFKNKDIFYSGPASETPGLEQVDIIDSPVSSGVKLAVEAGIVLQLAANLAGCTPQNLTPTPEFTQEPTPIVEVTDTQVPGYISITETPIVIVSTPSENAPNIGSTSTENAPIFEVAPYPSSIKEFENGSKVLTGSEAEERINALGAGEDLQALKDWYGSAGIPSSMQEVVMCEGQTGAHWNIMIKYPDGRYGVITLTSGSEAGKIVRDGGLVSYLYSENRPTFSFKALVSPSGYENVTQKVVADKNLWFAYALEQNDQLLGWANLDIGQSEEWVDLQALAIPTPEGPMGTFASFEGVTHDAAGYHITLGDSERVIDVAEATAEAQIVFDEEMSLYKIYDEEGSITAEYDPGQGKEGDLDYVPATGWVDVQKLSIDLTCRMGNGVDCMTDYSNAHTQNSVWFEFSSSEIFRYKEVKNSSGEVVGKVLLLQVISRDILQKPVTVWFMTQAEPISSPGVNKFRAWAGENFKEYGFKINDDQGKIFGIEQWKEWMPSGSEWIKSLSKNGKSYTFYLTNYEDTFLTSQSAQFVANRGSGVSHSDIILVGNGSVSISRSNW